MALNITPETPAEAKRGDLWGRLMAGLAACVLPDQLAAFERECANDLTIPRAWRDPLANEIALRREQIAANDIGRIVRERFDF